MINALFSAGRRSLRRSCVLRWQRCGERWVEILQCGVTIKKKRETPPTSGPEPHHWLYGTLVTDTSSLIGPLCCQSVRREGVDVISSVNQAYLSILLFACVQIDILIASQLENNLVRESPVHFQLCSAEDTAIMGVHRESGLNNSFRARGFR